MTASLVTDFLPTVLRFQISLHPHAAIFFVKLMECINSMAYFLLQIETTMWTKNFCIRFVCGKGRAVIWCQISWNYVAPTVLFASSLNMNLKRFYNWDPRAGVFSGVFSRPFSPLMFHPQLAPNHGGFSCASAVAGRHGDAVATSISNFTAMKPLQLASGGLPSSHLFFSWPQITMSDF